MKRMVLVTLVALMAGACAEIPKTAFKSGPIALAATDTVDGFDAAKDAIGLLRDGTFVDPGPFEDVEVTPSAVTVRTFKQAKAESVGFNYRGFSTGSSVFAESRAQVSIWLADVMAIMVEHQIVYDESLNQGSPVYFPGKEVYLCKLTLKDGRVVPFAASQESYAKRVAAGFSFLTKVAVSNDGGYPAAGCSIDSSTNVINAELIDGPFDAAGIPLGSTILAVDDKSGSAIELGLYNLTAGAHSIKYRELGEFFFGSVTKPIIVIDGSVPGHK